MHRILTLSLLILAIFAGGCQNTARGVEKDTERNAENVAESTDRAIENAGQAAENVGEKTSQALENAGETVMEGGENVGAATLLTPRIKTAITADEALNEASNRIDVDSTEDTVTLRGHVTSQSLKQKAEQVAQKEIKEAGSNQKIVNELQVRPAEDRDGANTRKDMKDR